MVERVERAVRPRGEEAETDRLLDSAALNLHDVYWTNPLGANG